MSDPKETVTKSKDQAPDIDIVPILMRLEELEERCTQLETTLEDTVTFDALAARITGKKTVKRKNMINSKERVIFDAFFFFKKSSVLIGVSIQNLKAKKAVRN